MAVRLTSGNLDSISDRVNDPVFRTAMIFSGADPSRKADETGSALSLFGLPDRLT